MLITITTAAGMGIAAYRLQTSTIEGRFTASANAGFTSDLAQVRDIAVGATDAFQAAADYMNGRRGIDWVLYDLATTSSPQADRTATGFSSMSAPLKRISDDLPTELINEAFRTGKASAELPAVAGPPVLAFVAVIPPDIVLIEYYDLAAMRQELTVLQRDLAAIALGVTVVGLVAALLAASGIQRPVRRVAAAARRLGQGELDIRLRVRGRDELADLTRSFNTMAGRLGASIEQQRRFIADVTHDLRTPVAAMIAVVDSLADADPEARARSARLLGTQTRRLARLVEDLLEISRFDAGVADFRPEPVDLRALLMDAVEVSASSATVVGDATVTADPRRLHTIACNLLVNAKRHGAEPVTVTIDTTAPEGVTVRFADCGPGVPADLMPILFDRFVRGDRSRTSSLSSGLGLAIARENALVHGGRLEVHNEGGAVFTLTLPRASAEADRRPATSRP
ncbi:HAMP domain-containing sensor histidine kinase [Actinophytocola sp.]|uniref:sensor histidine kinase n=1 Tax=Actinophytocola sp. TaxID=1872138 RepID=UPI002ED1C784